MMNLSLCVEGHGYLREILPATENIPLRVVISSRKGVYLELEVIPQLEKIAFLRLLPALQQGKAILLGFRAAYGQVETTFPPGEGDVPQEVLSGKLLLLRHCYIDGVLASNGQQSMAAA